MDAAIEKTWLGFRALSSWELTLNDETVSLAAAVLLALDGAIVLGRNDSEWHF